MKHLLNVIASHDQYDIFGKRTRLMMKPCVVYKDTNDEFQSVWRCKLHPDDIVQYRSAQNSQTFIAQLGIVGISNDFLEKIYSDNGQTTIFSNDAKVSKNSIQFSSMDNLIVGSIDGVNDSEGFYDTTFSHGVQYKKDAIKQGISTRQASTQRLIYYGGPVIGNVKVITIWWGGTSSVRYAAQLEFFYGAVTNSNWYRILSQYSTSTTTIGAGRWLQSYNFANAPRGTVSDTQIQTILRTLIANGTIPPTDENTYYAIHFAPDIKIAQGPDISCVTYCAYHSTMLRKGGTGNFPYVYILWGHSRSRWGLFRCLWK